MNEQQFWENVCPQENGCWLWMRARCEARGGYGIVNFNKKMWKAHRLAWFLTHGPIPEGKYVLHSCDNPPCVNPAHLRVGTQSDNMQDMHARGRHPSPGQPSGERHAMAKLRDEEVRTIHQRLKEGEKQTDLALEYGVSIGTIGFIAAGRTWGNLGLGALGRRLGSKRPGAKLTEQDIPTILNHLRKGETMKKVAEDFGVGRSTIYSIWHGLKWKHVPRD